MRPIVTTAEFSQACARLARHDFVAVDTEFIREHTFWPKLCLIQMAGPDDEFIVDPLAGGLDLEPFYDLMANERVVKVFHAARQDVEIVWTQARHALQHVAAIGAWSPYFAATWETRPCHSTFTGESLAGLRAPRRHDAGRGFRVLDTQQKRAGGERAAARPPPPAQGGDAPKRYPPPSPAAGPLMVPTPFPGRARRRARDSPEEG